MKNTDIEGMDLGQAYVESKMSVANTYEAIQQETGLWVWSIFLKTVLGICMFAGPCLTGIIGNGMQERNTKSDFLKVCWSGDMCVCVCVYVCVYIYIYTQNNKNKY